MTPRLNIEFHDDRGQHEYTLAGRKTESVTTILAAEGLSGSAYYRQEHRDRGSAVHKIAMLIGKRPIVGSTVEQIVANSAWDPSRTAPVLIPYGMAVAQFYLETGIKPLLVETPVASQTWQICGTLDLVGVLPNGKILLPDFKSGHPQEAAWVQTALYAMCLEETFGLYVDLRTVVWVQPTAKYQMWPPREPGGSDLTIGQSAVNLFQWRKRHKMLG